MPEANFIGQGVKMFFFGKAHRITKSILTCAVFAESDAWTTDEGEARPARITLNARLFDDFDPESVPVRIVDGRNGW